MRLTAFILSAGLLAASQTQAAQCTVTKLTSFDADFSGDRIIVKASIDGQPVSAMLDTGLPFNMISQALVGKLKLEKSRVENVMQTETFAYLRHNHAIPTAPPDDPTMMDPAGGTPKFLTAAHTVAFGEIKTEGTPFYVMGEPDKNDVGPDVIFGANFLETYDLEIDPAHNKVNIFFPDHCPGTVVYWTNRFGSVPIKITTDGHISLPVAVNGTETHAFLDTGSPMSLVDNNLAKSTLGIDPASDGAQLEHLTEPSGKRLAFYQHTFDSFDFGGAQFNQTAMGVAPDTLNWVMKNLVHDPEGSLKHDTTISSPVTLGMNHIQKLRLYFAFRENTLYFTKAGEGD
jgi:predicted aspartyl protease